MTLVDMNRLRSDLFERHRDGRLDVARLVKTPVETLEELSVPFLFGGIGVALNEVAPEVVQTYQKTHREPRTSSERVLYIAGLLDAVEAAEIDLSDREVAQPPEEEIQVYEIGGD